MGGVVPSNQILLWLILSEVRQEARGWQTSGLTINAIYFGSGRGASRPVEC